MNQQRVRSQPESHRCRIPIRRLRPHFARTSRLFFFGADEKLAGTAGDVAEESDSVGEREMAVESAGERENVQSVMQRHRLPTEDHAPAEEPGPLFIDDDVAEKTPIIPDRPEDRDPASHVIDLDIPIHSPQVSSVNIETSFVANKDPVDLGNFRPKSVDNDSAELVIEDPEHLKDASLTALGEFFKKRKDG